MLLYNTWVKKVLYSLIFILYSLILPASASAHLAGQPPYFRIDGQYSPLYPVPLTSLSDFPLPQDMAPGTYLINQNLHMDMDITRLPAPPDVVKKTQFSWDFGDGDKGAGLSQDHTYKKMGSYILTIKAFDGTTPAPQLLESVLINVLPDWNYKLPVAVIKVEGQQSKDPLTDILRMPLGRSLHFDASSSKADSSRIVSYFWDFGDQKSSSQVTEDHSYTKDTTQIFPVLRVKDANGFIADNFVEVENQLVTDGAVSSNPNVQAPSNTKKGYTTPVILGLAAVLIIGGMALKKRSKRN
jgi:hypothetical protein